MVCSLVDHDILQIDYKYDESSIGYRAIPDNATTKILEALGATINFIDLWLKLFRENYNYRCDAYKQIIIPNKEMKYEMDENNHQYWLNRGPW